MRLPTPVLLVLLALTVAVLCGLGAWQIQRHQSKLGLVEERAARLAAPPLEAPDALDLPPAEVAWRRVHLVGTWDHSRSMVLANRVRYGIKGEGLVTPLLPASGGAAVLVDRGWYPESERERVRASLDAERQADIVGLGVDASGRTARRTPHGTWTALAPKSMSATEGIPLLSWAVIQGTESGEDNLPPAGGALPVRSYRPFVNTTPHLQYALTWFGIAAALVGVAVARFIIAPRRKPRDATAHQG